MSNMPLSYQGLNTSVRDEVLVVVFYLMPINTLNLSLFNYDGIDVLNDAKASRGTMKKEDFKEGRK